MFLYYLPNKSAGLKLPELREAGLGYAFEGGVSSVGIHGGPDGGDGVLLADPRLVPPEQFRFEPGSQQWRKIPGVDAWVGKYAGNAPCDPIKLARSRQLGGHPVTLADGAKWLAPIARGYAEEEGDLRWYRAVPCRSTLNEAGHWEEGEVLPPFAPLWDLATRWEESRQAAWAAVGEIDTPTVRVAFDFQGLHEGAVQALAINYRIGPAEVALLGLLTVGISREILDAAIDLPTRLAWFKKKQQALAGSNTADGSSAATPATGQPAPISGR